jgi:hypothetical protein
MRMPAVGGGVDHDATLGIEKQVARPQVTVDACGGHIPSAGGNCIASLFDQVPLRGTDSGQLRKGQHALLGIEFTPVIGGRALLFNGADEVFAFPSLRRTAKGRRPSAVYARELRTKFSRGLWSGRYLVDAFCNDSLIVSANYCGYRIRGFTQPPEAGSLSTSLVFIAYLLRKGLHIDQHNWFGDAPGWGRKLRITRLVL